MFVSAIIAAGGRGTRLGAAVPKQLLTLSGKTILQRSFDTIAAHDEVQEIVLAVPPELVAAPPEFLHHAHKPVLIVEGGRRRQDSVARAFEHVSEDAELIVIHDAARPLASAALFSRVISGAREAGAAVAAIQSRDTVKRAAPPSGESVSVERTLAREQIYLAQTPQAFLRQVLIEAMALGGGTADATDEASLAEQAGHTVRLVEGEPWNVKITTAEDLRIAQALLDARQSSVISHQSSVASQPVKIGTGYDLHRLVEGRPLIIGGVRIPYSTGLAGHSDADVLSHAVTDAILGAAGEGDIGRHFPDTDPRWKDASSLDLLKRAADIVRQAGYTVSNVDAVVIAERPKLAPYVTAMRERLADAMGIDPSAVSVKGKTNEGIGALGRNEAIAVHAVAMVRRAD